MPEYDKDGNELTVQDMAAQNPVAAAPSFSELAEAVRDPERDDVNYASRYAVEGNDVSNFVGVSEEYRTYASEVDSPGEWDGTEPDNSDEKLAAQAGLSPDEVSDDDESDDDTAQHRAPRKAAAKKSAEQPPIQNPTGDENK